MKISILYISLIFIIGCTKSIVVKQFYSYPGNIHSFGLSTNNNFYFNETKGPKLNYLWDSGTHGSYSNTSFLAHDSTIITSDLGGRITAINITDGKTIGELKYDGGIEQTAIISNSNLAFIVNENMENYSTFVVYNFMKGDELSETILLGKFSNELIIKDDFIYAVSDLGNVYCLDQKGHIIWDSELNVETYSNPAADDKYIYIPTFNGDILCLLLKDGEIDKEYNIGKQFQSGVSMDKYSLYIGDIEGAIYSINKSNGNINWKFNSNYRIVATPGYDENNVYFGNLGGEIYSISKLKGEMNWMSESGGLINTSPLLFENILIQSNLFLKVDVIDIENGDLLNQINFDTRVRTTPIYFRDRLIFGVDKGDVFCYSFEDNSD